MVTYGGVNIFGSAVQVQHVPRPRAAQTASYFGVSGTQFLDGGSRGRVFSIRGVLTAASLAELDAAENTFLACADGVARTLVDNRGRTWSNVVFKGEFVADARGVTAGGSGWALPYRAVFYGLT
ncbi:hypothetical protein [Paludisphaera rhizosphaerae]|uniref:hypothetical protein n=1 Tax=Paludisphaera rhizosphaerae TaxID=2711216 RepID=UPI0013EB697B|nr:hypothetical protein [Paludisphaera rhizosphaerae]